MTHTLYDIIQSGLQQLSLPATDAQIDALVRFVALMEKWNKAYNLTAIRNPQDMARLHILDSVAIVPHIHGSRVADIGTGAGLPGIPLAILLPDCQFTLLDANAKKTRFVQQAILELKLKNVSVQHARVEQFQPDRLFSTVIMRAFASLPDILTLTRHLIADDGILLAMKGQPPEDELAQLNEPYTIIPLQIPGIDAQRCLIRLETCHHD